MNGGDYPFVTLFEAALIIGMRIEPRCPQCLLPDSVSLFLNAVLKREIEPRHPSTHLPCSKAPTDFKLIDGEIIEIKEIPDMSWTLSLKEVAEFAILKGYPEHLFTDLLGDTKAIDVSRPSQEGQCYDDTPKLKKDVKPSETPVLLGKNKSSHPITPEYLDENHPMFSRELSIAIDAWLEVLSSNPKKPKTGSRKNLIKKWLQDNHKNLTDAAIERIVTMINPDKNGGAPSSD